MHGCCGLNIVQLGGVGGPIVNIYNTDGTLTGPRTINQNNNNIIFNTGTGAFIINGKLTVTGMIDPIGLQFTASNTIAVGATGPLKGTIFVSDGSGGLILDHPYFKDAAGTLFDLLDLGSLTIGHNIGANYIIPSGTLWKISSGNNTIDTVNLGGFVTGFDVRIDPNPLNTISTSVAGLFVPSGGSGLSDIVSLRQTVFGGQGFVNNVETDITWETAEIDTASLATVGAGTGFITIGTTGIYEIHTAINWDTQLNNTGFRQIGIKINGVTDFLTSKLVTENPVMYLTRILNLTAGDVITVYGFHQTFPGTIRTKVNPTQNETSLLHLKKIR